MRLDEVGEIGERECKELLATHDLGRLAVVREGRPQVFLLGYTVDASGAVVVEVGSGTEAARVVNHQVTFEVDHVGPNGTGWCVTVHGLAHHTAPSSLRYPEGRPGVSGRKAAVRIHPRRIVGQRVAATPSESRDAAA